MDSAVRLLFHEVADLTRSEREKLFAERQIDPELRAEIESLFELRFEKRPQLDDDCHERRGKGTRLR